MFGLFRLSLIARAKKKVGDRSGVGTKEQFRMGLVRLNVALIGE